LIAVLDIAEDSRFERHGDDLMYDLGLSFTQAALGAEIEVPTPYGPTMLKVQSGTQTGAVYRLRGKGLPRVGESGRGDLNVRVHVWTPIRLTAEQRALLEQLAKVEGKPPSEEHTGKKFWEQLRQAFGR
jgi:molecular chaperone DnaJ